MIKKYLIVSIALLVCACSSVNIRTDGQKEASNEPSYQQRYHYWWWGLKGRHSINVREICSGQTVEQMQAVYRPTDALYTIFTLGIYSPRTARIWCGE